MLCAACTFINTVDIFYVCVISHFSYYIYSYSRVYHSVALRWHRVKYITAAHYYGALITLYCVVLHSTQTYIEHSLLLPVDKLSKRWVQLLIIICSQKQIKVYASTQALHIYVYEHKNGVHKVEWCINLKMKKNKKKMVICIVINLYVAVNAHCAFTIGCSNLMG